MLLKQWIQPTLTWRHWLGNVRRVRFDGIQGRMFIDRRYGIRDGARAVSDAQRQSAAIRQSGVKGVWEGPNERVRRKALRMLRKAGVTNIKVRIIAP